MTREDICQALGDEADDLIFFDPADTFDPCLVGWVQQAGRRVVCYDGQALVEAIRADGLSDEEAQDYLEYNVYSLWVGDRTPMILYRPDYST